MKQKNYEVDISSLKKSDEIQEAVHKFDTFDVKFQMIIYRI